MVDSDGEGMHALVGLRVVLLDEGQVLLPRGTSSSLGRLFSIGKVFNNLHQSMTYWRLNKISKKDLAII